MHFFRLLFGPPSSKDRLEEKIDTLIKELQEMNPKIQQLKDELTKNRDANASAIALIHGFADQVEASKGDDEALDALLADVRSQANDLATAVLAGTPQGSSSAQAVQAQQAAAAAATPSNAPPAPAGPDAQLGNTGATPGAATAPATVPDASTGTNNTPDDSGSPQT